MAKAYTYQDVLMIGKRHNNNKRAYLLVNPLQSKHIPTSPSDSLDMMCSLGKKVAAKYPCAKLVIGFAETATAIGAAVASCLQKECIYIHTTREEIDTLQNWIEFKEEHSHAVDQKLYAADLGQYIETTNEIILVDDEISTGKTVVNMLHQLRLKIAELQNKKIIVASIINRLTESNTKKLMAEGIECEYLVKLPAVDYTNELKAIDIASPIDLFGENEIEKSARIIQLPNSFSNPRLGISINDYIKSCQKNAEWIFNKIKSLFNKSDDILVLGTEEFMYPAIVLALEIEKRHIVNSIKCHATTRSPIGINNSVDYPIKNGYKLPSFYDSNRETYIYNLKKYDKVVIITDSNNDMSVAINKIIFALRQYGNEDIYIIGGVSNVQYL